MTFLPVGTKFYRSEHLSTSKHFALANSAHGQKVLGTNANFLSAQPLSLSWAEKAGQNPVPTCGLA
jgi:hypothetical protein